MHTPVVVGAMEAAIQDGLQQIVILEAEQMSFGRSG